MFGKIDKKERAFYAQFMRNVANINLKNLDNFRAYVDNPKLRNLSITEVHQNVSVFNFVSVFYVVKYVT